MPDMWMDVDTAIASAPVNILSLIDDTDFKTRETSVAYNAAGMDLVWNFTTTAGVTTQTAVTPTTSGNYDWTNLGDGMYAIEIPASGGASINNDTEGVGWFTGVATGVLPWRGPTIGFRASALNNSLIDAGTTGLLAPTTAARTLDVTAGGTAGIDWANIEAPTTTVNLSGTSTLALEPTTAGRKLDVTTTGEAGIDWANIGAPTTSVNLSGTTISTSQVVDSVSGAVGSVTGAVGSVTGNVGGNVAGSVGSVTGNVGGNVAGTVASVVGNVGGDLVGDVQGNVDGTIGGLTAAALADFFDTDSGETYGTAVAGSVVKEIADNANVSGTIDANVVSIDGQTATAAAGVTFPATLASTTNITAGTITTVSGNVNGSVGSVTGAVGSVTGNVSGNVTGSVGSVVGAVGSVTGNVGGNVNGSVASVVGNVGGNVAGSVGSVTAAVTVGTNNDKTGYALSSAGNNAVADAYLDRANAVETGLTPRQAMRLGAAADAGLVSGAATTTVEISNAVAQSKTRITATVDADGNRTAVSTDVT